jgi:hypothetical protein
LWKKFLSGLIQEVRFFRLFSEDTIQARFGDLGKQVHPRKSRGAGTGPTGKEMPWTAASPLNNLFE